MGDGSVQIDAPQLHLLQEAERRDRFAYRVEIDDSVALPELAAVCVDVAGPDVEHGFAVMADGEGGAHLVVLPDHLRECGADGLQTWRTVAEDLNHGGHISGRWQ